MYRKIIEKLKLFGNIPPFEVMEYIVCKFNSKIIKLYIKSCGKRFYMSSQSTVRGANCISIGDDFYAGKGFWIECLSQHRNRKYYPEINIGNNFSASQGVHIAAILKIEIGNNVLIGSNVIITDHLHGSYNGEAQDNPNFPPVFRNLSTKGNLGIHIGNNVWVGDGVVILPGVTIGDGCIVGANCVVSGVIDKNTVIVGNPCKAIKRFDKELNCWIALK